MEKRETRIVLNEITFTNLCKFGYLTYPSVSYGKTDVHIYKAEMKELAQGKTITKNFSDELFIIVIDGLQPELTKEIVKRSPIYSELYYEI